MSFQEIAGVNTMQNQHSFFHISDCLLTTFQTSFKSRLSCMWYNISTVLVGWYIFIYCVLGLQLGHLVLISWEIPLVIYFILFKLVQSFLSTSLNIRWINLKKKTQILFHLVIHILSHGSTQLTIHLELTVLYHKCLGRSVFERVGWSTKYPYINLTHFHKELKQDLIIKYVNLYFIFMTNWYHIAACDTIKSPDNYCLKGWIFRGAGRDLNKTYFEK